MYYPNDHYKSKRPHPAYPFTQAPYYSYSDIYTAPPYNQDRQQPVSGQATWTDGGQITQCGIPWSDNLYMTAAVGENSPYQCGQTLKIRNLSIPGQREILVTVVDQVPNYPPNRINLHRKAFETLGANVNMGVIHIDIIPSPELDEEKWGKYLLEITQTAYPNYQITEYSKVRKTKVSATRTEEVYEYVLQAPQDKITVRGTVVYNPKTDKVISFDIKEI
ncbi:DUF3889 domain-containing protein [Virgibacillus sp. Bac332]|nr:DUF3889 domain-containing protein [Virgibacillus sp. Bac332]